MCDNYAKVIDGDAGHLCRGKRGVFLSAMNSSASSNHTRHPIRSYLFIFILGLCLLALSLWGSSCLDHWIEDGVRQTLKDQGHDWVTVSVRGRHAYLGGIPPQPKDRDRAIALISEAKNNGSQVSLRALLDVKEEFRGSPDNPPNSTMGEISKHNRSETKVKQVLPDSARKEMSARSPSDTNLKQVPPNSDLEGVRTPVPPSPSIASALPTESKESTPSTEDQTAYIRNFAFQRSGNELQLSGEVSSEFARRRLVEKAKEYVGQQELTVTEIKNELKLVPGLKGADLALAERAIDTLSICTDGRFSASEGQMDVKCVVPQRFMSQFQGLMKEPFPEQYTLNKVDVLSLEEVNKCDTQLDTLMSSTVLEFATGSARLGSSSTATLKQIAQIVRNCPGVIVIEGHTDNIGTPSNNKILSQSRAQAVADALTKYGLSPKRLTAVGYGDQKPLADNASSAGRQRNRRIEIRVQKD